MHMSGGSKITREHLRIRLDQLRPSPCATSASEDSNPIPFSDLFASHPTLQEAVWHHDPDLSHFTDCEGSLPQYVNVWRRPPPPSLRGRW